MKFIVLFTLLLFQDNLYSQLADIEGDVAIQGKLKVFTGADSSNMIMGLEAGDNILGLGNLLIGRKAGNNIQSGIINTIVGQWAGQSVTNDGTLGNRNGEENTYIGYAAGSFNTNGSWSTMVGSKAGLGSKGYHNAFFGSSAGRQNTESQNTFIGTESGQENKGRSNVFLGFRAGSNFNPTAEYSDYSVFIGQMAGANETRDQLLIIENSESTQPLIYGEFANDRLGVNWNSSTVIPNTLSVKGTASKTDAGDWVANSDARLKKNIRTLNSNDMLQKVLSMKGVSYEWDDNATGYDRPKGIRYGFTAQDLQKVWPENVSEDPQGYLQTGYGTYDHVYVEAIKALNERIVELEKKNFELGERMEKLKLN